ncbi:hypothetical protein ACHAQA_005394 [Verticillium albo-atrum]
MACSWTKRSAFVACGLLPFVSASSSGNGVSSAPKFNWHDTKSVLTILSIAFGDSYTFVLGTHGRTAYSFIGDYLPGNFSFTPEELLENKIWQNYTGTSAGGPNWIEHLTDCAVEEGSHSPLDCDVQLWDFAFAGSNTAEALLPLHHNFTVPLVNQTQQFLTWADPVLRSKTCLDRSRSLVAIWIGINDINDLYQLNLTSRKMYADHIQTMLDESVEPLYGRGYRSFLFVGLPPLDRNPGNQKKQADLDAGLGGTGPLPNATMIGWWYDELRTRTETFKASHEDATAIIFDTYDFLNDILDDPAPYGITNTTGFCEARRQWPAVIENPQQFGCPVPVAEYFWFDSGHIGTRVHKAVADGIRKVLIEESEE